MRNPNPHREIYKGGKGNSTRFVLLEKFHEITGHTPKAVNCKLAKGVWAYGREVRRAAGRLYVDLEAYELWILRTK